MARSWQMRELPEDSDIDKVALRRCSPFLEASMYMYNIGQDFMKVLMVSCYLQGIEDAAQVLDRVVGVTEP